MTFLNSVQTPVELPMPLAWWTASLLSESEQNLCLTLNGAFVLLTFRLFLLLPELCSGLNGVHLNKVQTKGQKEAKRQEGKRGLACQADGMGCRKLNSAQGLQKRSLPFTSFGGY